MDELIKVNYENVDRPTVSGRELWEALEVGTPYHKWIARMCEYGFSENVDFVTVDKKVRRADGAEMPQTQHDHQITIPMAKEKNSACFSGRKRESSGDSISLAWKRSGTAPKQSWQERCSCQM